MPMGRSLCKPEGSDFCLAPKWATPCLTALARAVAVIASSSTAAVGVRNPSLAPNNYCLPKWGRAMAAGGMGYLPPPAYGEALALQNLRLVVRTDLSATSGAFSSAMKSAMEGENPDGFKKALKA